MAPLSGRCYAFTVCCKRSHPWHFHHATWRFSIIVLTKVLLPSIIIMNILNLLVPSLFLETQVLLYLLHVHSMLSICPKWRPDTIWMASIHKGDNSMHIFLTKKIILKTPSYTWSEPCSCWGISPTIPKSNPRALPKARAASDYIGWQQLHFFPTMDVIPP